MPADQLSTTFAALADPTRRAILARLVSGECSVTELAEPFDMSMPAVSKHLRVLERAGLIARGREAQWRPCRIEAAPLKEVAEWAERYRHIWEGRLDRLGDYLRELKARESKTTETKTTETKTRKTKAKESRDARKPRRQ
jgi:DNA-binding transcriptional ArsR family regulator